MNCLHFPGKLLKRTLPFLLLAALCLITPGTPAHAQAATPDAPAVPALKERIEVTATRVPEDVEPVPAAITIVTGDELRARGAYDLQGALALASGVAIAPGGDGGPAGSVPEFWGLREFDAFLLVVDGIPWGGAFNPALTTLDLNGVERIEIIRGAAPVLYGATSFVGVIHVIHQGADSKGGTARIFGGSYGSGGAAVSTALPAIGNYRQSLLVDGEKQGFKDDRTSFNRGHLLYRGEVRSGDGVFHFDLDAATVHQKPASPTPRTGRVLTDLVPIDSNQNPTGAKINEDRTQLRGGYDLSLGNGGSWSTTVAATHTERETARGFLTDVTTDDPNGHGFRQNLKIDDLYFDTHVAFSLSPSVRLVAGFDHLYGSADNKSGDFDYFVNLNGKNPPSFADHPNLGEARQKDKRNFSGLYAQAEWNPAPRWHFQVGGRLNRTRETSDAAGIEFESGETTSGSDSKTVTRGSGAAGLSYLAWQRAGSAVWLYADYRTTYKPAALDFGPDADAEILNPETAQSWEVGAKGMCGDRLHWDLSVFQMDFKNLVVAQIVNGAPGLVNAGAERFNGAEVELDYKLLPDLRWQVGYSYHDARFEDFVRLFDDTPTQLRGKRLELSARNLVSTGLTYAPARGVFGSLLYNWTDERFLNQRNTALAPSYGIFSASLGYAFERFSLRVEGFNLGDRRDPVAESELGDAQYYRQPARSFRLTLDTRF